jgi:type VI secretion system protein ImpG
MGPRLLQYYTDPLLYMRERAVEFAAGDGNIARRLGMQAGEIGDPYVERLIGRSRSCRRTCRCASMTRSRA